MLRGAIIGFGDLATRGPVPAWRRGRDVEIVGAADVRPVERAALETHLPGARWYDSSEELLADARLDFVDIATPPSSHAPLIRRALERGLHVLCEKPLVHSLDDLGALRALAGRMGRVLHTVHNWHHAPIVRRTAALVREGAIGRVTRVDWHTLRTRPAVTSDGDEENWRFDPLIAGGGGAGGHGWAGFFGVPGWGGGGAAAGGGRPATARGHRRVGGGPGGRAAAPPARAARRHPTWAAAASRSQGCRADGGAAPRRPARAGRGRARAAADGRGGAAAAAPNRPGGRARRVCGHPSAQGARRRRGSARGNPHQHAQRRRAGHATRGAPHRDPSGERRPPGALAPFAPGGGAPAGDALRRSVADRGDRDRR